MFSQASVILFTWGVPIPACTRADILRQTPPRQTPPGQTPPWAYILLANIPWGDTSALGRHPTLGRHPP